MWDATHFTAAKRIAYAIVEVVTRYWIGYLLTSEQTQTGAAAVRPGAPGPGRAEARRAPPNPAGEEAIQVAWSDNGTEMTAIDTRQFMAPVAIVQHHGRPGTPTDHAHVESFFSHLKATGRT
jgi:putative transposase